MHRPPAPAAIPLPVSPELPRHVGIIMDGNGRWAKRRHLPRAAGHRAGVRAIRPTIDAWHRADVNIITLYAFSTENWSRPSAEVGALMRLFSETIASEIDELHKNGIQIRTLGELDRLNPRLREQVLAAEKLTANNQTAILNVAINYGGRAEIVAAVRDIARCGSNLKDLDEATLAASLYTAGLPDPDLIVRTAGEHRISNFLLWQSAYSEIHVTETLWPDFGDKDVLAALQDYSTRIRRFGGVQPGTQATGAKA